MKKHFLIVGGGLSGICVAHLLEEKGHSFKIIDADKNVSSKVAAGIFNPVVFRRLTLSWRLNEVFPFALKCYEKWGEKMNSSFFKELTIRRFFASEQEKETWLKKQEFIDFKEYIFPISEEDKRFPSKQNTFGTGRVKQSGYISSEEFMEINLAYFQEKKQLSIEAFNYEELETETAVYQNETYDFILFCEGKDVKYNPYFSHLPIQQTKGELIDVELKNVTETELLNRKCFLLPLGNQQFKIGSTYVWDTDNTLTTKEGTEEILSNLQSLTDENPKVIRCQAGIRPTTLDRRPILGKHPSFPKLVILNGLGAKGYMLAPLMSKELLEHLLENKELSREISIQRFNKL